MAKYRATCDKNEKGKQITARQIDVDDKPMATACKCGVNGMMKCNPEKKTNTDRHAGSDERQKLILHGKLMTSA